MCFRRLVVGVASDMRYRNGSESREMVPLRKGAAIGMCFGRLVVGVASDMQYRNDSESRKTVPLRKGGGNRDVLQKACGRGCLGYAIPQRQ